MSKLELVFAILHTSDITIEKIKAESPGITDADAQNLAKVFAMMDGKKALLLPPGDNDREYCFIFLADKGADRELNYQMEQDSLTGCYIGQREKFNVLYDNDEYSPDALFFIDAKYVEVIPREAWLNLTEIGESGEKEAQQNDLIGTVQPLPESPKEVKAFE